MYVVQVGQVAVWLCGKIEGYCVVVVYSVVRLMFASSFGSRLQGKAYLRHYSLTAVVTSHLMVYGKS